MATVWNGVNSVSGGQCVYLMLHAIFPSIATLPNHMSASSALTTANLIGFFIFILLTGLVLLLEVPKWNLLIHLKLIIFAVSTAGMLALAITKAGGPGPIVTRASTVHGTEKGWLIARFILTTAASCSTFASNAADWQRNATKPSNPILGQLLGFPLSNMVVQIIGMIVASTSVAVYGTLEWNPVTYLDMLLTDNYDAKHRAGAFFIAAGKCDLTAGCSKRRFSRLETNAESSAMISGRWLTHLPPPQVSPTPSSSLASSRTSSPSPTTSPACAPSTCR